MNWPCDQSCRFSDVSYQTHQGVRIRNSSSESSVHRSGAPRIRFEKALGDRSKWGQEAQVQTSLIMSPFHQLTPRPTRWGSAGSAAGRRKSPSSVHERTGFVCVKHEPCRDCCFPTASPRSALKETPREDLSDGLYLKEMRERGRRSRERETDIHTRAESTWKS